MSTGICTAFCGSVGEMPLGLQHFLGQVLARPLGPWGLGASACKALQGQLALKHLCSFFCAICGRMLQCGVAVLHQACLLRQANMRGWVQATAVDLDGLAAVFACLHQHEMFWQAGNNCSADLSWHPPHNFFSTFGPFWYGAFFTKKMIPIM